MPPVFGGSAIPDTGSSYHNGCSIRSPCQEFPVGTQLPTLVISAPGNIIYSADVEGWREDNSAGGSCKQIALRCDNVLEVQRDGEDTIIL